MKEKPVIKEKFCKTHNQPYLVACMRCAMEDRKKDAKV